MSWSRLRWRSMSVMLLRSVKALRSRVVLVSELESQYIEAQLVHHLQGSLPEKPVVSRRIHTPPTHHYTLSTTQRKDFSPLTRLQSELNVTEHKSIMSVMQAPPTLRCDDFDIDTLFTERIAQCFPL